MARRDADKTEHPQRNQTDVSLRVERARADALRGKEDSAEDQADEVMRVARERADEVVRAARDDADHGDPRSPAAAETSDRERADEVLETERATADAVLATERAERRRYLYDFLAIERDATDKNLIGERTSADTALAVRDDFLGNVSHDLRSLLGGLSLRAVQMSKQAPAGEAGDATRKHAAASQRMIARMNRLVNDLLDVVSIEAGELAVTLEQVEVAELVRETLDAFEPIAAARDLTLAATAGAAPLGARVDGGRILQVLANLVSNAIKFTPAGGRVSIEVRPEGDQLHFVVSDTGIGISDEAQRTVFERFRQVSADRRGLGLGLHISKCIVQAHGGRMWVESQPGAGSSFHFVLPAARGE